MIYPGGILVQEAGEYEILAQQRSSAATGAGDASGYICLAIDGNRDILESREDCMFTHDHTAQQATFASSSYIGGIPANTLITAGAPVVYADRLAYGAGSYVGVLTVRRIS